jgi:hypothetical protein
MTSSQEIAAASVRLSKTDIRAQIEAVRSKHGERSHRLLPILRPHLQDILLVAEAGKLIAELFGETPDIGYTDYDPGVLPFRLTQRFSQLPQYTHASKGVKNVIRGIGYEDVIGIFLAGEANKLLCSIPGINAMQKQEFLHWADAVLGELDISPDDPGVDAFEQFATLTKLLYHTSTRDCFQWMNHSRVYLQEEALLESDCEKLVRLGIRKTPDLAQTSVHVLAKVFRDDLNALHRLSAFLTKRNLSFGMKFPVQWE